MDSKNNVIVNVHVEPANVNDMKPIPEILDAIAQWFFDARLFQQVCPPPDREMEKQKLVVSDQYTTPRIGISSMG